LYVICEEASYVFGVLIIIVIIFKKKMIKKMLKKIIIYLLKMNEKNVILVKCIQ